MKIKAILRFKIFGTEPIEFDVGPSEKIEYMFRFPSLGFSFFAYGQGVEGLKQKEPSTYRLTFMPSGDYIQDGSEEICIYDLVDFKATN